MIICIKITISAIKYPLLLKIFSRRLFAFTVFKSVSHKRRRCRIVELVRYQHITIYYSLVI